MVVIEKPRVSVIIATYNRHRDLERCLNSLMRQTFRGSEIIVIDNGSTDNTPSLLKNYSVKVIRDDTRNLYYIYNLGWRCASADIVSYLSDDSEVEPNWLENSIKTFKEFKGVGAVAGPVIAVGEQQIMSTYDEVMSSKLLWIFGAIYEKVVTEGKLRSAIATFCESGAFTVGSIFEESRKLEKPVDIDIFGNNNIAVKRSVLEELGGFDENFRWNGDGDFYLRMRRRGYRLLFNPKAVVWHYPSKQGPTRMAYYIAKDFALFYMKNVRPRNIDSLLRFLLNIFYFNVFWMYKYFKTKRIDQLKGIKGFLDGIVFYFREARKRYKMGTWS
jgi:GT2 family glycosyltransferase